MRPNPDRYDAFSRLLAEPDPPDLPRRSHAVTQSGDPDRRNTVFQPLLSIWAQHRHLDVDSEFSSGGAVMKSLATMDFQPDRETTSPLLIRIVTRAFELSSPQRRPASFANPNVTWADNAPRSSWWARPMDREAFSRAAGAEYSRMRNSRIALTIHNGTSGELPDDRRSRSAFNGRRRAWRSVE